MQELLNNHGPEVFVVTLVLLGTVAVVVPLVCFTVQWAKVRQAEIEALTYRAELEATLKQEMLNRGMSADEMRQVLEATPGTTRPFAGLFGFLKKKRHNVDGMAWDELGKKWAEFGKKCGDAGKRHFGCWKS